MNFHLNFNTGISPVKLQYQQPLLLIGSCFTEHIEKKLSDAKFNTTANPFGIVFNPASINITITRIIEKIYFTEKDIFENNGSWFSLETHSSLTQFSKTELLTSLNLIIDQWHTKLKTAHWLIITFGTAFYYQHIESNATVANCHKLPAKAFNKQLSDTAKTVVSYNLLLKKLADFNPHLTIIFTISPVKHLRDGVIENNLSKAILIQCVHAIIKENKHCIYFPAYELVNDDLRDYRFYEEDMAHPNKQAINYVWDKFCTMFFDKETMVLINKMNELNAAYNHRVLNNNTKAFYDFKLAQYHKCLELKALYPYLNLEKEIHYFSN